MSNPLAMSDEDFMQIDSSDYGKAATEDQVTPDPSSTNPDPEENADVVVPEEDPAKVVPEDGGTAPSDGDASGDTDPEDGVPATAEGTPVVEPKSTPDPAKTADPAKSTEEKPVIPEGTTPDYQSFYDQVMKPFKANGRTIELKSPDEVIRLMQMGAGFGRKMQDIQPHLKVLRMLEKNDLLDEKRLSFLIDINQRNPDAIKQVIKDSGMDPLDIDPEDNVPYQPQNHAVTDQEMRFHDAVKEIHSAPNGSETIDTINKQWDDESKSVLWEQPEILSVIQAQRETGVYDLISTEIDRQKMLGIIPQGTTFLKAYKAAGDYLANNGQIGQPPQQTPAVSQPPVQKQQPQVIATRPVSQHKPQVANSDKVAAAAASRSNGRPATPSVNPLALSDDDFMKQFGGRL